MYKWRGTQGREYNNRSALVESEKGSRTRQGIAGLVASLGRRPSSDPASFSLDRKESDVCLTADVKDRVADLFPLIDRNDLAVILSLHVM